MNNEEMSESQEPVLNFKEEDQNQEIETQELETSQEQSHEQVDPVSQKAKKFGHLSKEEWEAQGRDPSQWKSPEQFVKYGDEYGEVKSLITNLKTQNAQQAEQIKMLVEYHKQQAENAIKQARHELEAQLRLAKEHGDAEAVEKITEQKINLNNQAQLNAQQQQATEVNRINAIFLDRNKHWFNQGRPDLVEKTQNIANEIDQFYPSISYADKVRRIEERMKFEHPEIVVPSHSNVPQIPQTRSSMNKTTSESSKSEESTVRNMTAMQKAEYETFRKSMKKIGIDVNASEYVKRNKQILSQRGDEPW